MASTRTRRAGVVLSTALTALSWLVPAESGAAEIKLLCTNGMRAAVTELVPAFERETGHKVTMSAAASGALVARIKQGEAADLVLLVSDSLDELAAAGQVGAAGRRDLARSGVGVAVKAGRPKPDVSSVEALRAAVLSARSIGYTTGVSGALIVRVFERLGVAEQAKAKTRVASGEPVSALLVRGDVELGFQQTSELFTAPGVDFVGSLPAEVQTMTLFSGGVLTGASSAEAARALLDFLAGPAAAPVLARTGMETP